VGEILMWVGIGAGSLIAFLVVFAIALSRFYRKVGPEEALVRSGGGKMIANSGADGGMWVVPIIHRVDHMDLTVKRIEITRKGQNGLICRDNIRADIEVVFFVRVNNDTKNIQEVAESIGCDRASTRETLVELFDAKFSEALKTSGKKFDFADLYTERDQFKADILEVIGKDLNGYQLDDCAIDYLEQTPLEMLSPNNILDAEGIKKITELTAAEKVQENNFTREKEKTLKRQDVAADEVKFELEKQRVAAKEKQEREIAEVTARENAQALKVQEEERLKAEEARISTAEAVGVAEENKNRQIIVAVKNKERTNAVETERVERDRQLEVTERERLVGVAQVEKDKAMEVVEREKQEVIRERVVVERGTVEEREKIKDTEAFYGADRQKKVSIVSAEEKAQEALVTEVKAAEASKQSASLLAEKTVIEAEAARAASEKEMQATKMLAEARTADSAAEGLAEAQVITAKADAQQKEGGSNAFLENLKIATQSAEPSHLSMEKMPKAVFFSFLFIPLSVAMFPHVFQHWLTARSAESFKLPIIMHPVFILIVWAPCVLLGVWASGENSGVPAALAGMGPEKFNKVLPTLVKLHAGDVLGGLLSAGILAAIMSSLDSQFLCLGTVFTEDVVRHYAGRERYSDAQVVRLARYFVVGVVVLTYLLSLLLPGSVFTLGLWSFSGFTGLVPLVFAAIYWRRLTAAGAIASVATTVGCWTVLFLRAGGKPYTFPEQPLSIVGLVTIPKMLPVVTIFAASGLVLVVVSLLTRRPEQETLDKFFSS